MDLYLLPASAFLISCITLFLLIKYSNKLSLTAHINSRSSHFNKTPTGGGVSIVLASIFSGLLVTRPETYWLAYLLGISFFLALVGLWDDLSNLSIKARLFAHFVVVSVTILLILDNPPIKISGAIEIGAAILPLILIIAAVWWVNLFNFMDGIDGLAGMQALFMLTSGATALIVIKAEAIDSVVFIFMLCTSAATIGFLIFNWSPAKIFMGDVGSLWLAFILFTLALTTISYGWLTYEFWLLVSGVFIVDATITLVTRILTGERWYEAHKDHAYQKISQIILQKEKGKGTDVHVSRYVAHRNTVLAMFGINLLWLTPLAVVSIMWPQYSWWCVILGYAPLILAAIKLRAGRPLAQ